MHLGIAVELQRVECGVGFPDVFVEGIAGGVARQDFCRKDLRLREFSAQIRNFAVIPAILQGWNRRDQCRGFGAGEAAASRRASCTSGAVSNGSAASFS